MYKIKVKSPFRPICPSPAGLIVSTDRKGNHNIMTCAEIFNIGLSNPVIIGIALRKATYTHGLITNTKEFSVNLPTTAILEKVDRIGSVSGRDGLDKFAAFNLTPITSTEIIPPIIGECPINLECILLSITEAGDHDLFLGQVKAMHVDSDKIDEKQRPIVEKLDAVVYAEGGYYRFGEKLGTHGFSNS